MPQSNTVDTVDLNINSPCALDFDTAWRSVLLAVDSSDHSNRATKDGIELGKLYQSTITASHVYAAQMHDMRFKQMEGGLPEPFKEEDELERQRDIHDSLITRGLSIITDSYLLQAEAACQQAQLNFKGCSLEGKNYKMLVNEANNGQYDLLVMGALGLGAIEGSSVGTVCERTVRRSHIDTLVIKQPQRSIKEGPLVVAIDGSGQSYAALLTAFKLAGSWQLPLHIVSAFDPYYHYVAFNRIARVLSDEAGQVFRFKEQEQLHEEIIDDGLARIYQGHLDVALKLAEEFKIPAEAHLLTGKPHFAIQGFLKKTGASLLLSGKTGIHRDDELDIGGNAENLLRNAPCALLFTQREFTPRVELLAETTTSWTTQAEQAMQKIPPFVQKMARSAILRYAAKAGHTVITASIVAEATKNLCPAGMKISATAADSVSSNPTEQKITGTAFDMNWSDEASKLLQQVSDQTLRHNTRMRAEKRALTEKSAIVTRAHILPFIVHTDKVNPKQQKAAGNNNNRCPFSATEDTARNIELPWDRTALEKLQSLDNSQQTMIFKAATITAHKQNLEQISLDFLNDFLTLFEQMSAGH